MHKTKKQQKLLKSALSDNELVELQRLLLLVNKEEESSRLPMIDLASPALKQLSNKQQIVFTKTLVDIIKSDAEVSRFEWVLVSVIKKHLTGNSLQKLSKGANKKNSVSF